MSDEQEHPFVPGLEVAYIEDRWGFSMKRFRVAKVHKTGRFTLEGSPTQYRASEIYDGEWIARATNRDRWSSGRLELITPELLEKAEHAKNISRVHAARKRLERISEASVTTELAAELERLADILCRKDGD